MRNIVRKRRTGWSRRSLSAGIGAVIAENASIAGASGGCQAEIGSASAMAAGGLAYLRGGDAGGIERSGICPLKNMLGLTCDPVCGLVEVPCIMEFAGAVIVRRVSVQMAMAGIKSAIPADEVVRFPCRIGNALPAALRETSEGGLAVTESARKIAERMGNKEHIA
ncbi:MAG: L-serine ammonia-lyase, iron-sulfur-dependent, subunit beta [Clostridium fessum]